MEISHHFLDVNGMSDEWIPNILHEYAKRLNYNVILFLISPTACEQFLEIVQTEFPMFRINQLESLIIIREMKKDQEEKKGTTEG